MPARVCLPAAWSPKGELSPFHHARFDAELSNDRALHDRDARAGVRALRRGIDDRSSALLQSASEVPKFIPEHATAVTGKPADCHKGVSLHALSPHVHVRAIS